MKKSNKFSPEVRRRAVRMVQEHRGEYPSLWAAIATCPGKEGQDRILKERAAWKPVVEASGYVAED